MPSSCFSLKLNVRFFVLCMQFVKTLYVFVLFCFVFVFVFVFVFLVQFCTFGTIEESFQIHKSVHFFKNHIKETIPMFIVNIVIQTIPFVQNTLTHPYTPTHPTPVTTILTQLTYPPTHTPIYPHTQDIQP